MKIPPVFYTYIYYGGNFILGVPAAEPPSGFPLYSRRPQRGLCGRSCPLQSLTRRAGSAPCSVGGGCTGSGFRTFFREKLRKTPKTGPSGRPFSVVFCFFSDKKPLFYTCNVLIHSEDEKNKKKFSHSVACKGKAVFLQSRFARHTNGAREGGCAPARGARGETGRSSLNEWNDVANNSRRFF